MRRLGLTDSRYLLPVYYAGGHIRAKCKSSDDKPGSFRSHSYVQDGIYPLGEAHIRFTLSFGIPPPPTSPHTPIPIPVALKLKKHFQFGSGLAIVLSRSFNDRRSSSAASFCSSLLSPASGRYRDVLDFVPTVVCLKLLNSSNLPRRS